MDNRETFMYANMNLLTDEECELLLSKYNDEKIGKSMDWNREYELCIGKKHSFPKHLISFQRKQKKPESRKAEIQKAKQS